ncbi:MAG: hypothetical protein GPJ54_18610 [Candidatus Heimdallarchaeota archaeon]|nr:hypothetical protein [Candidatus Heimdallarchaeota archaeon]
MIKKTYLVLCLLFVALVPISVHSNYGLDEDAYIRVKINNPSASGRRAMVGLVVQTVGSSAAPSRTYWLEGSIYNGASTYFTFYAERDDSYSNSYCNQADREYCMENAIALSGTKGYIVIVPDASGTDVDDFSTDYVKAFHAGDPTTSQDANVEYGDSGSNDKTIIIFAYDLSNPTPYLYKQYTQEEFGVDRDNCASFSSYIYSYLDNYYSNSYADDRDIWASGGNLDYAASTWPAVGTCTVT